MSEPNVDKLKEHIQAQGALLLSDYMAKSARYYYGTRDPFGKKGDFTTAPEISQMFGELIGIWLAQHWRKITQPKSSLLVELGPGRGTLMADLLRAGSTIEGFVEAQHIILVEQSPYLRNMQKQNLPAVDFVEHFETIQSDKPLYLIANEFFDALPINQFEMTAQGWRERCIGLQNDQLCWQLGQCSDLSALPEAELGTIAEICPLAEKLIAKIAHHISSYGGAGLIIDYGAEEKVLGDSLQAVRRHQSHPILEMTGEADITAHVRFSRLADIASAQGALVPQRISQKNFLEGLGIRLRAEKLLALADHAEQQQILSALHRLTAPSQMGTLFKVMMILPHG